jgi:endonuclease YncB( thermonuclease family)
MHFTESSYQRTDMKKLLFTSIAALLLAMGTAHAESIKELLVSAALAAGQIPAIVDGDTIRILGVRIRLTDYDSPELFSPKCPSELMRARAAKLELERVISQVKLELVPCATSNWGRLCAQGMLPKGSLSDHMINVGLASPYVCRPGYCPPKISWCSR